VHLAGDVDFQGCEQVAGGLGDVGALPEGAGGAGEGADADPLQFAAHGGPCLPGVVLGDADEQEREPAEQDVRADALFEPVAGRPQVQDGLYRVMNNVNRPTLIDS
jgi:hypothetical protein